MYISYKTMSTCIIWPNMNIISTEKIITYVSNVMGFEYTNARLLYLSEMSIQVPTHQKKNNNKDLKKKIEST